MEGMSAIGFIIFTFVFSIVVFCWIIFWKAWAVWIAARQKSKTWFFVLLFINTAGILEIFYVFHFYKARRVNGKIVYDENVERPDLFGIEKYFANRNKYTTPQHNKSDDNVKEAEIIDEN